MTKINITDIEWVLKTEFLDDFISSYEKLLLSKLPSGLEAEVVKVQLGTSFAVVKIWNKGSSPDIEFQYAMLHSLKAKGISVSVPYGWGYYKSFKILATSFDGAPVQVVDKQNISSFAQLLREIHNFPTDFLNTMSLIRKFDFIDYFFPRIMEHPDLHFVLKQYVKEADIKQEQLIHGDYNLGNILEQQGQFTVIDWTNAQLGDPRYDVAWASFLIRIYNGEDLYHHFLNSYFQMYSYAASEIELFEAVACLRWLLINRFVTIPKNEDTDSRVNHVINNNCRLKRYLT